MKIKKLAAAGAAATVLAASSLVAGPGASPARADGTGAELFSSLWPAIYEAMYPGHPSTQCANCDDAARDIGQAYEDGDIDLEEGLQLLIGVVAINHPE